MNRCLLLLLLVFCGCVTAHTQDPDDDQVAADGIAIYGIAKVKAGADRASLAPLFRAALILDSGCDSASNAFALIKDTQFAVKQDEAELIKQLRWNGDQYWGKPGKLGQVAVLYAAILAFILPDDVVATCRLRDTAAKGEPATLTELINHGDELANLLDAARADEKARDHQVADSKTGKNLFRHYTQIDFTNNFDGSQNRFRSSRDLIRRYITIEGANAHYEEKKLVLGAGSLTQPAFGTVTTKGFLVGNFRIMLDGDHFGHLTISAAGVTLNTLGQVHAPSSTRFYFERHDSTLYIRRSPFLKDIIAQCEIPAAQKGKPTRVTFGTGGQPCQLRYLTYTAEGYRSK